MKQRGRKSAAKLSIVAGPSKRPEPPPSLTEDAARVWRDTVGAVRVDWIGPESFPVLEQFCRHVAIANQVAAAITSAEPYGENWARLVKIQLRESQAIASLATKLRLTVQSTRTSRSTKAAPTRPWELIDGGP